MRLGLMITERCNFKCDHCMFSCTNKGMNMRPEVIQAVRSFINNYDIRDISIYGGEPFLDVELFDTIFREVYDSDVLFFVSTNGTFMGNKKRRDYVFRLIRRLQFNEYVGEGTNIRISNTVFHRDCRSKRQYEDFLKLKYLVSDPYSYYDEYPEDEYLENPFSEDRQVMYIDEPCDIANPSGRAFKKGVYQNGRCCYCEYVQDEPLEYETSDDLNNTNFNIKPNGDINVCCRCDSATVGNILEDGHNITGVVERMEKLRKYFKKKLSPGEDAEMIDFCPQCKDYKVTDEGIFYKNRRVSL